MNEIAQKPKEPLDVIKDKNSMLLTRVQSFTSKEVSDACKGMNERILESTALICERISTAGGNPSPAVLTITNLSKRGESNEEMLIRVMEKLAEHQDRWFLQAAEKLSQTASPERLLNSIPLLERVGRWNKRKFAPSVEIDETNMLLPPIDFVSAMDDDQLGKGMELAKLCVERSIKPDDLYKALTSIAGKSPTKEQFDGIIEEFTKLLPALRKDFDTAPQFFLDRPEDVKTFTCDRPEWTLNWIAENAKKLPLDEFIQSLTSTRKEYIFKSLLEEVKLGDELVLVIGSHSYRPDLNKYKELLVHFTNLLDEAKTPDDPRLVELKQSLSSALGYSSEYGSELCKSTLEKWKKRAEKWQNEEIAKRLIPNELGMMLSRLSAVQDPEGSDVTKIKDALESHGIKFKMSTELSLFHPWPREINSAIMDNMGRITGYIRNIPFEQQEGCFIGDGGASVAGPGFTIFSDAVSPSQIETFKKFPTGLAKTYQLPGGYTTLRLPASKGLSEDVLLETMHIDNIIAVIPGNFVMDGKPLFLIDPRYYKELTENPKLKGEFQSLLEEQELKDRVVVIPEEEAHLNVANLAFVGADSKFIMMNNAKKTIDLLVEKGLERKKVITVDVHEMHAFRGSIGCCITHVKSDEMLVS